MKGNMKEVSAIVVTYNRKELLSTCIDKLANQTYELDILVIDNASTDGTREMITNKYPSVIYENTGENLGGAGGFSYGIKKAVELGYKYLWILDDDTFPEENALMELVKYYKSQDGSIGYLSSKVLWKDGSLCEMNRQKVSKWKYVSSYDLVQNIQYASFVSMFICSDIVRDVGLPYKEFFIWSDDWEFSRRISKKYPSKLVPQSVVWHWCNNNVGADIINTDLNRLDRFKYLYRNDVVLYRQDGVDGFIYMILRLVLHVSKIIIKADNKKTKLSILFNGTKEGFQFHPVKEYPEE